MSEQARAQWLSVNTLTLDDPIIGQWLFDQQSLTRRLSALSDNAFSVIPLKQSQAPLREDECQLLNLPQGSLGWVREVYLCGHDEPWVYARSVAPLATLTDTSLDLAGLGNRSLGERLFSDPAFTRSELTACVYPATLMPATDQHPHLWARRSCFTQQQAQVLVTEVFLPAFWQHLKRAH